jgi:DNA/RNA endonuclease YhcR with UshA esterase domain
MRFSREEIATFIILVCAVLAIGALYTLTGPAAQYSPASADGDHVTVSGQLLFKETTRKGGHVTLCVGTDFGPLSVFVPSSSDAIANAQSAVPGKEITVAGRVRTYKNKKEVVADSIKEK